MRVSTLQMSLQATNAMLQRQSDLSKTQEQLASGKRIVRPSDDPLGSVQLLGLHGHVEQVQKYQTSGDAASRRLVMEESALDRFADGLMDIRTSAIYAANTTFTATERGYIAGEIREKLAALLGLANTKDGNGDYLFAGHEINTVPFAETAPGVYSYQGDSGQRSVQIGPTRTIATSDPGDDVFVNVPYSGGGNQDIFTTLANFATGLEAGTVDPNAVADIDAALENIAEVRARIGTRLNAIDDQMQVNEDDILRSQTTLSSIQDLDYAEAISRLNLELAGLQASQQSYAQIRNLSLFNYL